MLSARRIPLLTLLAAATFAAGCGGSSGSSSSSSSSAATATSSTVPTPAAVPTVGASAVATCKHGVQAFPQLAQAARERLEALCERAASSNAATRRKATEQACRELIKASPLPPGQAKDRALAGCDKTSAKSGG